MVASCAGGVAAVAVAVAAAFLPAAAEIIMTTPRLSPSRRGLEVATKQGEVGEGASHQKQQQPAVAPHRT